MRGRCMVAEPPVLDRSDVQFWTSPSSSIPRSMSVLTIRSHASPNTPLSLSVSLPLSFPLLVPSHMRHAAASSTPCQKKPSHPRTHISSPSSTAPPLRAASARTNAKAALAAAADPVTEASLRLAVKRRKLAEDRGRGANINI